jgi:hypothetical protein
MTEAVTCSRHAVSTYGMRMRLNLGNEYLNYCIEPHSLLINIKFDMNLFILIIYNLHWYFLFS